MASSISTEVVEMSDCCKTKSEYLVAKAKNFRDYISRYHPAPEVANYLQNFKEELLIPTLLTIVVPIVRSNTTADAVRDLMKKMTVPEAERDEVATKICRYMEMFVAVLSG
jgi:hypothetical protein